MQMSNELTFLEGALRSKRGCPGVERKKEDNLPMGTS